MAFRAALAAALLVATNAAGTPPIQNGTFLPDYGGGFSFYYEVRAPRARPSRSPAAAEIGA
jgi:hypothetical protein